MGDCVPEARAKTGPDREVRGMHENNYRTNELIIQEGKGKNKKENAKSEK